MFDNLRDSSSPFYEEEPNDSYQEPEAKPTATARPKSKRRKSTRFLGLTSQQRFILATMMMLTVCVMGTLAMFVLGKMSLF